MWIVKLGGSWVSNPELQKLIDKLYNSETKPIKTVFTPTESQSVSSVKFPIPISIFISGNIDRSFL